MGIIMGNFFGVLVEWDWQLPLATSCYEEGVKVQKPFLTTVIFRTCPYLEEIHPLPCCALAVAPQASPFLRNILSSPSSLPAAALGMTH